MLLLTYFKGANIINEAKEITTHPIKKWIHTFVFVLSLRSSVLAIEKNKTTPHITVIIEKATAKQIIRYKFVFDISIFSLIKNAMPDAIDKFVTKVKKSFAIFSAFASGKSNSKIRVKKFFTLILLIL